MRKFEGYTKGIDFGGWLSQCREYTYDYYDSFIKREDFKVVKEWGMDHIRLPIDWQLIQNPDGSFIEKGFTYIQNAIDWAGENGLNLIIDLHKTIGYSFDEDLDKNQFFQTEALHEHFYAIWREFSNRYAKYEERVAFELLNEVTSPTYSDTWNMIIRNTIKIIRKVSPTIKILVGGYWNNSIDALKDLEPPADGNIVYNFHCYDPLVFTHQGAGWIKGLEDIKLDYPLDFEEINRICEERNLNDFKVYLTYGKKTIDKDFFINKFKAGIKLCEERNVPLYCGEYGVIDRVSPEYTLAWYKDINAAFVELGMSRACWTYRKLDFGLSDDRLKPVIEELKKYM